jgi:predicted ATPase
MQWIVTTHSEVLVDALSATPEAVVVCEKEAGATTFNRLSRKQLSASIDEYGLGRLWSRGEIGGNRW